MAVVAVARAYEESRFLLPRAASIEHEDLVGLTQGGQPVRTDEGVRPRITDRATRWSDSIENQIPADRGVLG
jgi:hypothetical protein